MNCFAPSATDCRPKPICSLTRRSTAATHAEPALAAYYTLTFLSPYVVGEARDYLNYLRSKYLR